MPRVVTYTIQPVTASECKAINVSRQSDGDGGTVIVETATFEMKDAGGNVVLEGQVSVQLTPAQRTALASHITSVLVPAFNTKEAL